MARAKKKIMIQSIEWQYLLAVVIMAGFAIDCFEAQLLPEDGSALGWAFFGLDACITLFFTMDLAVNLFANSDDCFRDFYASPANWMDFVIVIISILGLYWDAQGVKSLPFKMIRVVRVLKVLPLIKQAAALSRCQCQ